MKIVLVAAVALVDPDGRVLLAQRPDGKSMAGLWEFPGGKVRDGRKVGRRRQLAVKLVGFDHRGMLRTIPGIRTIPVCGCMLVRAESALAARAAILFGTRKC